MAERSLFERLAAARDGAPQSRGGPTDVALLVESIIANLGRVLNSRAGCSETRPDLGIPDFNDLVGRFPDAIQIIATAVRDQIIAFEPRLQDVTVRHVKAPLNPLSLTFDIHARIRQNDEDAKIIFQTVLGDDGFMRVRG
ncbi:type VI secretion system baseplate subunit TssE [Segnochrobactrum spirostomi]|uniref:Type VI secretion system baseplate subunit TssE n=1 Tax=Segnochrobactrum spirostomi TaxID=2608987 RepID=A0A6A7YBN2_9HYPH|nr:type VI secretion system baseplate subunit TssE [Segnochrobactrum spirostomi]MQT15072.1 type VI secretion system baseplate subunit TssE [Segnochrobactrum spirostomi]